MISFQFRLLKLLSHGFCSIVTEGNIQGLVIFNSVLIGTLFQILNSDKSRILKDNLEEKILCP